MENLFNFCFEDFGFPETLPLQTLPVVEPINSSEEVMKDGKKHHLCTFPSCGKIFRFKSELSRHSVVHNAQRTFNCPHAGCYKTFKREDALKNHIRIHTGEQPFKCDFQGCEESFPTKAGLRYHMLKHNGEKTFMCSHPSCGKAFLTQAQLRQHENSINYHKKINWQVVPEVKQATTPMTKIERETTVSSPIPTPAPAVDQFFVSNPKKTKEVSLDDFFVPSLESGIEWGMQNQHEEEVEEEAVSEDLQENFERMVKVILKDNNAMKQRLDMCNTLMGLMHENNALKQKLKKATGEYEEPQFSEEKTFSFLNLSGQQNVGF